MKKNIFMSSLVGLSVLTVGGMTSHAAEFEDNNPLKIIGEGEIGFTKGDIEVVDPTDPTNPVEPVEPVNPNSGDLAIQYVSDFQFGSHQKSVNALSVNAGVDHVKELQNGGKDKIVPLYVSTMDMRTERGTGWTLSVTSSEFKSNKGHVIDGGEVTLSHAAYANADNFSPSVESTIASDNGQALTPGTPFKIAGADAAEKQGIGSYSLAFGKLNDEKAETTGVTFNMPAKTVVDTKIYKATFNWNLSPTLDLD